MGWFMKWFRREPVGRVTPDFVAVPRFTQHGERIPDGWKEANWIIGIRGAFRTEKGRSFFDDHG